MKKYFQVSHSLRIGYSIIGWAMVVLGVIGFILPIMPTVPFLLAASWCFSRSSPRFHGWLCNHRIFGPLIKTWEEKRAILPLMKVFIIVSMACGFVSFLVIAHPVLWLVLFVAAILLSMAIYIITRPSS
ncbi:YbaN family protein [Bartonella sp. B10]